VKDPFYQQIADALAGPLDHGTFERCMGDLLRKDFPGLVPVPGGSDSGVDGLVAEPEAGQPFPLICTTEEDVIGNLTRSLESYLLRGLQARKVAVATSQSLTPPRRLNLFDRAKEKGFSLMQVFDRPALADRLYENSRWCRELLGLTGAPSVLSIVPSTRRPLIEIEPVGREVDLAWLQDTRWDRVLSGEPGSGKTFLLYYLMRRGWPGLFLAPGPLDLGAFALALQEKKPEVVVVDDAQVDPGRLADLVRLRREKGMDFQILATTWKGGENEVIDALGGLPSHRLHRLELLSREQILRVLREVGMREDDDELMAHLVEQASNKPGLAVTIASLWLQGSWQEVVEGTALQRTLTSFFDRYLGKVSTDILASFSLGGAKGMPQEVVREFLGIDRSVFRRITAGLYAGGVLFEAGEAILVVRPPALRVPLLRSVFFPDEGAGIPYRESLLERAPSREEAVLTLIKARARGARISDKDLRDLVLWVNAPEVWQGLAWVSEAHARWVLDRYGGDVLDVVQGALDCVPQVAVQKILERASELHRAQERPDRAMSLLLAWVQGPLGDFRKEIQRRRELARAAKRFLRSGGDSGIGVHGLSLALSPIRRKSTLDPGIGRTVKMRSGFLPLAGLQEIGEIWADARDAIQELDHPGWLHLSQALFDWIEPSHAAMGAEIPGEELRAMNAFAAKALRDLAPLASGSPGLTSGFDQLARKLSLDLGLVQDPVFLLLFPDPAGSAEKLREQRRSEKGRLEHLADQWAGGPESEIARRVSFYQGEAQRVGHGWINNLLQLCRSLAERVNDPTSWLEAFLAESLPEPLLAPFLERLVAERQDDWEAALERFLIGGPLGWTATSLVLGLPNSPEALLRKALQSALQYPMLVEGMCLRKEVPLPTLRALLRSPDGGVALASAVGEWLSDPEGEVLEEVRSDWRRAILRYGENRNAMGHQYWLGIILQKDSELAFEWLERRLRDSALPNSLLGDSPFACATRALTKEQRRRFLADLREPAESLWALIPLLIDRDLDLYRALLARKDLTEYHLRPLGGDPDAMWESLAAAALDAGYEPRQIAGATSPSSYTFSGSGLDFWSEWAQALERYKDHSRRDLREVALLLQEQARTEIEKAKDRERDWALYGLGRHAA
jgi:hypothetical protein